MSSARKTLNPATKAVMATRAARAADAAARPKVKKARKRRKQTRTKMDGMPVVPAPSQTAPRGLAELARLGQRLRLEPVVAQRRDELAALSSLMSSAPRGR